MAHDVVNIGSDRRQQVDALEVRRSASEADVQCVAVDHKRGLAEPETAEAALELLRLAFRKVEIVDDDEVSVLRLRRQRHLQAERAHLLVQRRVEVADPRAVRLAAADEDRSAAVAVASRSSALLASELLAGAGNVAALASGARRSATVNELPRYDPVKHVGAGLDAEHGIVELDVAAFAGVEGLDLDLHRLAFLALVAIGGFALGSSGSAGKGGDIELNDEIFAVEPRADILHRVVTWQLINRRAPARAARERSEVNRTGKKFGRQKGGGTARHGDRRAPIFIGGGKAHGPRARVFASSLNKKVRQLGLKMALSSKARDCQLIVLDNLDVTEAKTKQLKTQLAQLGFGKTALIIDGDALNVGFARASSNLESVNLLPAVGANVYDIMRHETLVLTRAAVEKLEGRFNG